VEQIEKVRSETVTWQHHFHAPPGEYILETVILDQNSGKNGAERVSFIIPEAAELPRTGETDAADTDLDAPAIESRPTGALAITFPATTAKPPAPDEIRSLLEDATQRAMGYSTLLPNFLCLEITNRSVDPHGQGRWKHQDSMSELLTYRDNLENRTMMEAEVYGQKSHAAREDLKGWLSHGEFGGMLKSVFEPSAKAEFQWKKTGTLADSAVQLFDYRVAREHSAFDLHLGRREATVGFHGEIFIESATRSVRRITMVADNLPQDFPLRAVSISVDYDYVVINNHDYLLPVDGEVRLRLGRRQTVLNQIEFRNYRRFGSSAKILDYTPIAQR